MTLFDFALLQLLALGSRTEPNAVTDGGVVVTDGGVPVTFTNPSS